MAKLMIRVYKDTKEILIADLNKTNQNGSVYVYYCKKLNIGEHDNFEVNCSTCESLRTQVELLQDSLGRAKAENERLKEEKEAYTQIKNLADMTIKKNERLEGLLDGHKKQAKEIVPEFEQLKKACERKDELLEKVEHHIRHFRWYMDEYYKDAKERCTEKGWISNNIELTDNILEEIKKELAD